LEENIFVDRFRTVARATVVGTLATSAAQGILSGLIFLLSLVPLAGTALVWVPWTIYLLATGSVARATIFLVLQLIFVGGADNILRPLLMEGKMNIHTLVVFFSILGGISYFGILGIFIGPLVFALAIAFMEFYGMHDDEAQDPADPIPIAAVPSGQESGS
jgi:predicted PurR-regulated permease PerM